MLPLMKALPYSHHSLMKRLNFWQVVRTAGAFFVPYFVIGIFLCSFYLMNLMLAVVYLSYEQELSSVGKQVLQATFGFIELIHHMFQKPRIIVNDK